MPPGLVSSLTPPALSTAEIVDAVLDEAIAGHVGAGTVGNLIERLDLIAAGGAGELTAARAANLDAAISSRLAAIKSTQRGQISMGTSHSATATISAVATAKTQLRDLGMRIGNANATTNPALHSLQLLNTTTVEAEVYDGGAGSGTGLSGVVSWELTEFN